MPFNPASPSAVQSLNTLHASPSGCVAGIGPCAPEDWPDIHWALPEAPAALFPLAAGTVSAGFPSPAADYEEDRFDPTRHLVRNPVSTFFFTVQGDSMVGA